MNVDAANCSHRWSIFSFLFLIVFVLCFQSVSGQDKYSFSKSGNVHDAVIHAWNTHYKDYFASEIKRRLFDEGDVYVLYDVQIGGLQSFVEMTRRCRDTRQISELVEVLNPVFAALTPVSRTDQSPGWVCTGGKICTAYNRLGKEVPLCSVQFLGLIGALATSVAENIPRSQQSTADKNFLQAAFTTIAVHMNRWLTASYFGRVDRKLQAKAADLNDGSRYYFTDVDLWYLTVLSDMAALYQAGLRPAARSGREAFHQLQSKKNGIEKIFNLFLARTHRTETPDGTTAEVDKGFWKYHFDTRYANYLDSIPPVTWSNVREDVSEMKTNILWDSAYISQNVGWDISHARRLVPALETFARNRKNIQEVWDYHNPAFDPVALRKAFAHQIVKRIWNGSFDYPLFSNFWSGDNGWYRVAYANQTGRQFSGYPPYGLNSSMPKGGYAVWGAFDSTLQRIFKRIFALLHSNDPEAKAFIAKYYKDLSGMGTATARGKRVPDLAFLSDLVELPE